MDMRVVVILLFKKNQIILETLIIILQIESSIYWGPIA